MFLADSWWLWWPWEFPGLHWHEGNSFSWALWRAWTPWLNLQLTRRLCIVPSFHSSAHQRPSVTKCFLITPDLQDYVLMTLPKGHHYFYENVFYKKNNCRLSLIYPFLGNYTSLHPWNLSANEVFFLPSYRSPWQRLKQFLLGVHS